MNNRILLLTKDALCKSYLPIYGNTYWKGKTPNLDELALKGTVFNKFYTSAPSTVMAIRGIVMGKFAFDTPYIDYIPMEVPENESDLVNYARIRRMEPWRELMFVSKLRWEKARKILRNYYGIEI